MGSRARYIRPAGKKKPEGSTPLPGPFRESFIMRSTHSAHHSPFITMTILDFRHWLRLQRFPVLHMCKPGKPVHFMPSILERKGWKAAEMHLERARIHTRDEVCENETLLLSTTIWWSIEALRQWKCPSGAEGPILQAIGRRIFLVAHITPTMRRRLASRRSIYSKHFSE